MQFISSNYEVNEIEAISTVTVQHLGKKFDGYAWGHPDDKENWSEFAGCSYAETRAMIEALKYERKLAKEKADAAIDFLKSCECYKNFDKDSETAKVLYRQINQRVKKVNDLADKINDLYIELDKSIKRRNVVINALKRKRSKEDN